jgi:hypothetical protein
VVCGTIRKYVSSADALSTSNVKPTPCADLEQQDKEQVVGDEDYKDAMLADNSLRSPY